MNRSASKSGTLLGLPPTNTNSSINWTDISHGYYPTQMSLSPTNPFELYYSVRPMTLSDIEFKMPTPVTSNSISDSLFNGGFNKGLNNLGPVPLDIDPKEDAIASLILRYNQVLNDAGINKKESAEKELILIEKELMLRDMDNMYIGGNCIPLEYINTPNGIRKIYEALNEQPQNKVLFDWMFCSINTSFHSNVSFNAKLTNVRQLITRVTELDKSEQGQMGTVWETEIKTLTDLIYLKTSRSGDVFHEFFIGYALNSIRDLTPNYMATYGVFNCYRPLNNMPCPFEEMLAQQRAYINKYPQYNLGINDIDYPIDYLVMEKISFGEKLGDILYNFKPANFDDFMSIYLQIIYSLGIAYEKLNYTHYDLHTNNILIRPIDPTNIYRFMMIPYTLNGETRYVKSRYLVKIIDYGHSHITKTYQISDNLTDDSTITMEFGNVEGHNRGGRNAFQSNPLHDIYKLTGYIMLDLMEAERKDKEQDEFDVIKYNANHKSNYKPKKIFVYDRDNYLLSHVYRLFTRFDPFRDYNSNNLSIEQYEELKDSISEDRTKTNFVVSIEGRDHLVNDSMNKRENPHMDTIKFVSKIYPRVINSVLFEQPNDGQNTLVLDCSNGKCYDANKIEAEIRM